MSNKKTYEKIAKQASERAEQLRLDSSYPRELADMKSRKKDLGMEIEALQNQIKVPDTVPEALIQALELLEQKANQMVDVIKRIKKLESKMEKVTA